MNIPDKINFIKTDVTEEGGAAYTRDEYISLTQEFLSNLSE
ncbi:hypothetical protein [Tepidibacter aestuarii]|nr:hypothetical protein [Tepidibacter aestuarii]CAH2214806.1 protein of unknown function [Tepidibacter aestuarii]